ncbi:nucleotide exchange factor GrpE [uncultured Fibrobacter sp.]|uniref:nucleotide exchange factor GrpE n=1 Tax=uncultured Fibrobacter sp. TaxID=261512 RepID=UPI0028039F3D|nr:nucleotide exchange factor GrpE [uncultured Fibrobacter sp.]
MSEENKTQDPQNDDIMKEAEEILSSEPQDEVSQTTSEPSAAESTAETSPEQPAEEKTPESQAEAEIESLKSQLNESKDRYVRLMAEFDNYRRRTAKEQLDIIETANAKLLEKLSEVLDNFERASHPDNNKQKDYDSFAKGIQMIHDQFAKILSDAGLEQLDPVGEPFDPNIHDALMNQPSDTVPESHVVQVFQKGYRLKNKLLKTAKVIVSSGPVSK